MTWLSRRRPTYILLLVGIGVVVAWYFGLRAYRRYRYSSRFDAAIVAVIVDGQKIEVDPFRMEDKVRLVNTYSYVRMKTITFVLENGKNVDCGHGEMVSGNDGQIGIVPLDLATNEVIGFVDGVWLKGLLDTGSDKKSRPRQSGAQMPIITLPDVRDKTSPRRYVMLQLEYGLIISNADKRSQPSYYLFCRDEKRIVKTHDLDVFLDELERIPDGTRIDMVSKCTVPFYTEYGVNIEKQYASIMAVLRRKRFILVSSLEDDERHASFCYCEGGFTILDEATSRRVSAKGAENPSREPHE